MILTASNTRQFLQCRRAYYCRHILKLAPRYVRPSLSIGRAFHKGNETGSIEEAMKSLDEFFPSSQEEANALDIAKATVGAMLTGYWGRFPKQDILPEQKFKIELEDGITLRGVIDGLIPEDGYSNLLEIKTAGQINKTYIERLELDHQVTFYFYATTVLGYNPRTVTYRMVRKPSIRPRKNETINAFCERLTADYLERPDFYFFEETLYRSTDDLKEFEGEIFSIARDIRRAEEDHAWYRNTSRCSEWGGCEYLPLCRRVEGSEDLYVVKEPNPELEEGNEDGNAA